MAGVGAEFLRSAPAPAPFPIFFQRKKYLKNVQTFTGSQLAFNFTDELLLLPTKNGWTPQHCFTLVLLLLLLLLLYKCTYIQLPSAKTISYTVIGGRAILKK